ncbi:MAG: hypothetical protein M0D57_11790 [Sphingobacteriales bacterium JAD_PAG50586_3]|nr:MAG: hypothetical protein M0D57_11790 [Sphingobacteriales bacterium JAD_PAG50586_3]
MLLIFSIPLEQRLGIVSNGVVFLVVLATSFMIVAGTMGAKQLPKD